MDRNHSADNMFCNAKPSPSKLYIYIIYIYIKAKLILNSYLEKSRPSIISVSVCPIVLKFCTFACSVHSLKNVDKCVISYGQFGEISRDMGLTHWGRVTHICVVELTIFCSDNGLSPGRHQAIIWTNAGILLIGPLGTNFSEILIEIHTFSLEKVYLKMSSGKWRPFSLGLNVLRWVSGGYYILHIDFVLDHGLVPDRWQSDEWIWRSLKSRLIEAEWRIYVSVERAILDSDNRLPPVRSQAIIWANAALLLIGHQGKTSSETWIKIQKNPLMEAHLKMLSAK